MSDLFHQRNYMQLEVISSEEPESIGTLLWMRNFQLERSMILCRRERREYVLQNTLYTQHGQWNEPCKKLVSICRPIIERSLNRDTNDRNSLRSENVRNNQLEHCKSKTITRLVEPSTEDASGAELNQNVDRRGRDAPDSEECESYVSYIDLSDCFKHILGYEAGICNVDINVEDSHTLKLENKTFVLKSKKQNSRSQKENRSRRSVFEKRFKKPSVKAVALDICSYTEQSLSNPVLEDPFAVHSKAEFPESDIENETNEKDFKTCLRNITWLPMNMLPIPSVDLTVAHIHHESLDTILSQMTSDNPPGPQTTMKYELLRVCTYRNFPQENKPYSIRLAGAGFYFAAEGDELTCYCCGLRKRGWTTEDIPIILHERASPSCPFFKRNLDVNVPVPHPPDTKPNRLAIFEAAQETATPALGAVAASAMALPAPGTNSLISESARHVAQAQKRALTTNADNRQRLGNMAYQTTNHPLQQQNSSQNTARSQNEAVTHQRGLGIDFDKPKHPQYAVKQVRRQSYENWPQNVHQRPDDLVDAGFYYAGFGDCVRCFYCGIGLRHWSEEDNSWIEHARWSANCVYLRQVKGDEFVDLVQLAVQYSNEEDEDIPGSETGTTESGDALRQRTPMEDTQNYLLTDAAQSVLEMGYQPRMVQKAIDAVLKQKGREGITATSIMEKVLEMEDTAATNSLHRDLAIMNLNTSESEQKSEKKEEKNSEADRMETKGDSKTDTKKILQQNKELKEQTLCKVCLDNPVCIVFLPCGHLVTCAECAPAMRKCPICRAVVKGTVKTYMA